MNSNIPEYLKIVKDDWFIFFCELGFQFYRNSINDKGSLNIAINVPFSKNIATALATGIAHAVYSTKIVNQGDISDWISNIPSGTLVFFSPSDNYQKKSYIFEGVNERGHPILTGMGTNKGLKTTLSKEETWRNILIAPEQNKYKSQRTLNSDKTIEKLYDIYGVEAVNQVFTKDNPYFFLIGNENNIREDTKVEIEKEFVIQDLLRIRKFGGRQYSFISDFYSINDEETYASIEEIPIVVDGANSLLRYYYDIKNNPKIIILNRQSPLETTLEAIDMIRNSHLSNDIFSDEEFIYKVSSINAPSNIEILCWRKINE